MEICFDEYYDRNNIVLIEIPQNVLDSIEKNEKLILKGNEQTILCTPNKSYELKYLDTTNNFLLLEQQAPEKLNLKFQTQHTLECIEINPKKNNLVDILKNNILTYNLETSECNYESTTYLLIYLLTYIIRLKEI